MAHSRKTRNDRAIRNWIAQLECHAGAKSQGAALHAVHALIQIHHYGGLRPNEARYLHWLRQAAALGDSHATTDLGMYYRDGLRKANGRLLLKPNPKRAFELFNRAAESGDPGGQVSLACAYDLGEGVAKNEAAARKWYLRAYHGDRSSAAANNIAILYRDRGDHRRAFWWFQRALAADDFDSLIDLGLQYQSGRGVRKDERKAVACFRRAVSAVFITEYSREEAMTQLGKAYLEGRGVKRSRRLGLRWILRAARGGHAPAIALAATIGKHTLEFRRA